MKTIVALATPPLNSAIHIIRVSGEETFSIINKICQPKLKKSGYEIQKVGIFHDKKQIDHVLVNKFIAPKSFTGEDIVEINCHGGLFLAEKIIKLLLKYGCQLAQPGEFTMRAVLNNKINLIQAEAINNLVKAQNDYAIQIANIGLNKKVDNDLKKYKEIIFSLVSKYEITIDYPDMDETINNKHVIQTLQKLINEFCSIIKTSKQINAYSHGINIAIVGEVNVGKSSLLNAFAKQERAIVTTTPGTTRDVIQVSVNIDGLTFNFYDTAGIRWTKNKIEALGIKKTIETINNADLVLFVIDGSKPLSKQHFEINKLIALKKHLLVINKSDLKGVVKVNGIKISALKKQINPLIQIIKKNFKKIDLSSSHNLILQSKVSTEIFEHCLSKLLLANNLVVKKAQTDLVLQELHDALNNILELLGEKKDFNFINEMFKNFCLGK